MGLGRHMVEAIVREHLQKPIAGDVLMIGRQTTYLSPDDLIRVLAEHGVSVSSNSKIELDNTTLNRRGGSTETVSDAALFRLLGANKVMALDHSSYEGAEIIHDLRYPIPENLESCSLTLL